MHALEFVTIAIRLKKMCNKRVDNSPSATGLELKISGQTGKMIEYLYVRSVWLYVPIMPRTRCRVNLQSIVE